MSQYQRIFRILGPIIGFVILYYVVTGAAGYFQQGELALVNDAAKAAVAAFTVIASTELAGTGIRVNAIAPAARTEVALASSPVIGQFMRAPDDPDGFDAWHPRNIAPLAAYLSSADCPLSGEVFHVRGGVVGHFQGWTIGGTVQLDRELTIADLRDALPSIVPAAPSRADAGGAAYASLRNAWRDDKTSGS